MRRMKGQSSSTKWYNKMSRGKRRGKAGAVPCVIISEKKEIEEKKRIKKMLCSKEKGRKEVRGCFGSTKK